jgi:transposase
MARVGCDDMVEGIVLYMRLRRSGETWSNSRSRSRSSRNRSRRNRRRSRSSSRRMRRRRRRRNREGFSKLPRPPQPP